MKTTDRRNFIRSAALGGLSMAFFFKSENVSSQIDYITQNVNRNSSPTDLKITDLRVANTKDGPMLKLYTNQDIYGLGEVRDIADPRYAFHPEKPGAGKKPLQCGAYIQKHQAVWETWTQGGWRIRS